VTTAQTMFDVINSKVSNNLAIKDVYTAVNSATAAVNAL